MPTLAATCRRGLQQGAISGVSLYEGQRVVEDGPIFGEGQAVGSLPGGQPGGEFTLEIAVGHVSPHRPGG